MKLEVDKRYLNRNGDIVLIKSNPSLSKGIRKTYPFCSSDDSQSYTELGTCFVSATESNFDLIEEVILTKTGTKILEIGKTYKDSSGGITTSITRSNDHNYPMTGTHTDVNGIVSTRSYTAEGFFNLLFHESNLDLVEEVEVEVEKPKFEVGKYYSSKDGTLFRITKIWPIENNLPIFPIEAVKVFGSIEENISTFTLKGTYFADNDTNLADLVCLEVVLDEEQKDTRPKAEIKEEDQACKSAGSNTFNSVEEVFLWLANGNKVQRTVELTVYDLLTFPYKPSSVSFDSWVKYVEPVRWFTNISSEGVICWVWDDTFGNQFSKLCLVTNYISDITYPFRVSDCGFTNAIPLSKTELLTRFSEDL